MKYRLKSIEAFQWMGGPYKDFGYVKMGFSNGPDFEKLIMHGPEGDTEIFVGDYLIIKQTGELMPIRKDVFEALYEPIE